MTMRLRLELLFRKREMGNVFAALFTPGRRVIRFDVSATVERETLATGREKIAVEADADLSPLGTMKR